MIVSGVLTTTASGTYEVLSYTVPSGNTFRLEHVLIGGEPTSWSTSESFLGYAYLKVNDTEYRGIETRNMQGDICGVYGAGRGVPKNCGFLLFGGSFGLSIPVPDNIEFPAGTVIKIMCKAEGTTSSRWRGTLIGKEVPPVFVETITARSFPMIYLAKPVKAQVLVSKVEGATITKIVKDYPEELLKTGKAKELRSKWS